MTEEQKKKLADTSHYYGDIVRRLLLVAGFILMIAILLDREFLSFYMFVGVFGVLAITILAGMMSPLKYLVMRITSLVCGAMFLIFEYLAIDHYTIYLNFTDSTFFIREMLAVIFIVTLYYSVKSVRGTEPVAAD